jgi:REP element-mobilizing transposase RayT
MILAYHAIFTAYGFWLPNDPRGSWSDFVRNWELLRFGPATKTIERRSLAHDKHNAALRAAAKQALRYPPVIFNGMQALAIARGFIKGIQRTRCKIYACSIMPDHVHLVVARHRYRIEQLVGLLKGDATRRLQDEGLHPMSPHVPDGQALPSPWVRNGWNVFLNTPQDIRRAIRYVNNNPIKGGLRAQTWSFVQPH